MSNLRKEVAQARVHVAAFGKHPGWDDHIEEIGLDSDLLVKAKRLLYTEGIAGNIDSGAWEKLEPEKRQAYVDAKAKERADVQKQIQEIAAQRDAYIREETKKANLNDADAFDAAVRTTITEQAEEKGFKFKK